VESSRHSADISVRSDNCEWTIVARELSESRKAFLKEAYVCPLLSQYNIEHVGIMNAHSPYEVLRIKQSGTFFLACLKGKGLAMIDGKWIEINPGQACIFPPHITNAFRAQENTPWEFAWVRYIEPPEKRSIANTQSPTLDQYPSAILKSSILGLIHELDNSPSSLVISSWANLIHNQVQKFASPLKVDDRLIKMLHAVRSNLSQNWTLSVLAEQANLSEEHLRRLCNEQLGRSPMQQVTFLRLSHAKNLIMKTSLSIEDIAYKVGYKSQFSFSNTFNKWIGCRPTALR